ncbi:P-loop containing nucleoside triphosphate hydrolase [Phytophthora cactorum]|nr:P-loop containing nucleoside triphosphate hydrolase [Phytophthora cactorum]
MPKIRFSLGAASDWLVGRLCTRKDQTAGIPGRERLESQRATPRSPSEPRVAPQYAKQPKTIMAEDSGMLDNGAMVWVPHDEQVWKKAVVVRRLDDGVSAEVRLQPSDDGEWDKDDGLEQVVNIRDIARMAGEVSDEAMPICNVFEADGANDMCTLNHLHEPAVLKNLELRFAKKMPTHTLELSVSP